MVTLTINGAGFVFIVLTIFLSIFFAGSTGNEEFDGVKGIVWLLGTVFVSFVLYFFATGLSTL